MQKHQQEQHGCQGTRLFLQSKCGTEDVPGFNHECLGMVSLGHCYKLYSSVCHGTPSTKGDGNLAPVPARGQCEADQDFGPSDPKWLGIPILPEGDRFALSS